MLTSCSGYIDTSVNSILLGLIVLVLMFFLGRYFISFYNPKEDPKDDESFKYSANQVNFASGVIASIVTFFVLVIYKQYLVFKGDTTLLHEPFLPE
jgi:Na+-driven multidrug efflux pump